MIEIGKGEDEVTFRLDLLPRKIREAMADKFEDIFTKLRNELFSKAPGRYLDQKFIESGVTSIGSMIIGYIEVTDKPGLYPIVPVKARILKFIGKRDGDIVHTKYVAHPYLAGGPIVKDMIDANMYFIQEELEEAAEEATDL